jgi:hypothetical protein
MCLGSVHVDTRRVSVRPTDVRAQVTKIGPLRHRRAMVHLLDISSKHCVVPSGGKS